MTGCGHYDVRSMQTGSLFLLTPFPLRTDILCQGAKQPDREDDVLPLPDTEFKNLGAILLLHRTS